MPRAAGNKSQQDRDAGGMFAPTHPVLDTVSDGELDDNVWETDIESETETDTNYFEAWETMPVPQTYDERAQRNTEKQEKAAKKRRIAEMCSAEHQEAGTTNNQQGKTQGPYGIGGLSKRSIQKKKKKLRDNFNSGLLQISEDEFKRQLASINMEGSIPAPAPAKIQLSISAMEGTDPSPESSSVAIREEEEESSASVESDEESSSASDESEVENEIDIAPEELEEQARQVEGDMAVDSIVVADDIAEWIDTVLDDAAPRELDELCSLAVDCLKDARKKHNYRSTVLFAALVDFYRWMPRMGRLRAALCVARNHGRGPAFQRVLTAQARFFEANGSLKPSHQG
ncbi:hypothetical protein B0H10DRAFT_2251958 [Mycena sp. CBHHK59/15]|nr:hypothetical protein B0H10DRAFT_2251958 [Mycena sp. CBHHK59/15]